MARRARRPFEVLSLSFLDVVSCGFGAIILLLVLSKTAEPMVIEAIRADLRSVVRELEQQLHEVRGESMVLTREVEDKREELSSHKERLARLQRELSILRGPAPVPGG